MLIIALDCYVGVANLDLISLSIGSSHCLPCPKTWYVNSLVIIFIYHLLLFLNLSVAVGTLNGLIFYVNIDSSKSMLFTSSTKAFSVITSMLNLEIGLDICFFKGMNTYWKTWIQLAFPMYDISLVIMIPIVSWHSIWFSMKIVKKSQVATLAILVLLSFTNLLRTIIAGLSQAELIPLFKAYHAPYQVKHRYWTCLLLFARIGIFLLIILYGHEDPNTILLAITAIVSLLLFIKGHVVQHIYKDVKIDIIETICYLNIVFFSAVKLALLNFANQEIYHNVATYISWMIALL